MSHRADIPIGLYRTWCLLGLLSVGCASALMAVSCVPITPANGQDNDPPPTQPVPTAEEVAESLRNDPVFRRMVMGEPGEPGPPGRDGMDGQDGASGEDGVDGLSCWDLDGDRVTDSNEDVNNDGSFDTLDCQGPPGLQGPKGDQGDKGEQGAKGDPGEPGVTDHGQLQGLQDDDHPQYLHVTRSGGSRPQATVESSLSFQLPSNRSALVFNNTDAPGTASVKYTDEELQIHGEDVVTLSADGLVVAYNVFDDRWIEVRAADFTSVSSRRFKRDIQRLNQEDRLRWLAAISAMNPSTYRYRWDDASEVPRLGLIAEELPRELTDESGESVKLYALTTALVAALQELKVVVDEQAHEIAELRGDLARVESNR